MQKRAMAEKRIILVDGQPLPDVTKFNEVKLEKTQIEVPTFKFIRNIQNGVIKYPAIGGIVLIARDNGNYEKFRNWYFNDEVHDVIGIRTDASGVEFARTLFTACESLTWTEPEYAAESPKYAQLEFMLLPYDVLPLPAA